MDGAADCTRERKDYERQRGQPVPVNEGELKWWLNGGNNAHAVEIAPAILLNTIDLNTPHFCIHSASRRVELLSAFAAIVGIFGEKKVAQCKPVGLFKS